MDERFSKSDPAFWKTDCFHISNGGTRCVCNSRGAAAAVRCAVRPCCMTARTVRRKPDRHRPRRIREHLSHCRGRDIMLPAQLVELLLKQRQLLHRIKPLLIREREWQIRQNADDVGGNLVNGTSLLSKTAMEPSKYESSRAARNTKALKEGVFPCTACVRCYYRVAGKTAEAEFPPKLCGVVRHGGIPFHFLFSFVMDRWCRLRSSTSRPPARWRRTDFQGRRN